MGYTTFTTDRLYLRPTQAKDAAFILKLMNTPKWYQFIGDRNVHSIQDAKDYIAQRMTPQLERTGFSNYTVIRQRDQLALGCCGLYDREGLEGVDIGFSFLPAYEGKGYAFEAAQCLQEAAFSVFNLPKVGAITMEENTSSIKLLHKLGLEFVKKIKLDADAQELLYYELKNPTS